MGEHERRPGRWAPLKLAEEGHAASFDRLFESEKGKLYNLALRLLGDQAEAEDIVQQTFLRALEARERFAGRSSPATWLYKIALNEVRLRLRKARRFEAVIQRAADEKSRPSAAEEATQKELAERIRLEVALLPEDQREALILSRYHGMSYSEVAEILDCSVGAVKARIFRAMETLRDRLRRLK